MPRKGKNGMNCGGGTGALLEAIAKGFLSIVPRTLTISDYYYYLKKKQKIIKVLQIVSISFPTAMLEIVKRRILGCPTIK